MRAGRLEEAEAFATRISKDITRQNKNLLSKSNVSTEPKELWNAVQQLTGRKQETRAVEGINARTLNTHYANTSTDRGYSVPSRKSTATHLGQQPCVSEWQVNSSSRQSEIRHVEEWARRNNLKVNPAKYQEIIFVDKRWYGFASPTEIHRIDALLSLTVVRRTDLFLLVWASSDVCAIQLMKNYSKESYAIHTMLYTGFFLLQLSHRKTIAFVHEIITSFFQIEYSRLTNCNFFTRMLYLNIY